MTLADRLRDVVRGGGAASSVPARSGPSGRADRLTLEHEGNADAAAEILEGEWRGSAGQRYLVVDRTYGPGHRHGRVAVADGAPDGGGCWPSLAVLDVAAARARFLFIDLETTGLAGGAGTYAFLVGCAWFEDATFRVRQFVLTAYGAEPTLLGDVADVARAAGAIATYNGRAFDVPLIETRFLFHRLPPPFTSKPHVDLLHAARRLWRSEPTADPARVRIADEIPRATCGLGAVERAVLGHVREHDVPGHEVPSRYFQYVRSGDVRPLGAVLEHNRLDLLSLALLTARMARLFDEGAAGAQTAREAVGLGRLYQRGGLPNEAGACFARAVAMADAEPDVAAEALRASAVLARSARRYDDAAGAWRRLLALRVDQPRLIEEACEALAVHHEHRDRNLHLARDFAQQSLQVARRPSRAHALEHRLTRLDRKLRGCERDVQPDDRQARQLRGRRPGEPARPLFLLP